MNLSLENVSKYWSEEVCGVEDITLHLDTGVTGLLGPNGAGKSTLMQMITTITNPTEGSIKWNGTDIVSNPSELRSALGYLPQDFGVYPKLTAKEFLTYMATLKGIDAAIIDDRVDELLHVTDLADDADQKLSDYSGGMRQRVGIAQALLNDPDLLVVDEPTVGLDPEKRARFRNLIADLSEDHIVLLSTHIVSDIEATATDVAIMNDSQLVDHMQPEELINTVQGSVWEVSLLQSGIDSLGKEGVITQTERRNDGVQIRVVSDTQPHPKAVSVAPSLEDAYLALIGGRNRETDRSHITTPAPTSAGN